MKLHRRSQYFLLALVVTVLLDILTTVFGIRLFGPVIGLQVLDYFQLFGALLGGFVAIIPMLVPIRQEEEVEPWLGFERMAWLLIGAGAISWGLGESAYNYELVHQLTTFPAISDVGYAALPPLIFVGLLVLPSTGRERGRLMILLDSLISMGAMLSIAWFLLLGSLAQTANEDNLAKFLGLYYPVTDIALLSSLVFLILRGQAHIYEASVRRLALLLVGLGIVIFAVSDFNYNVQNNLGTYQDSTWLDLGWSLGLILIGVAAYLRRFAYSTPSNMVEKRVRLHEKRSGFGIAQFLPYLLLGTLLLVLVINGLSNDATQVWNRPVLLFATVGVVVLVIIRQLITQLENEILSRRQNIALRKLAIANGRVKEQAHTIARHSADLEEGIAHLKEVQAQIANGNMRARARVSSGNLVPLAGSLNLMAERLLRFDQVESYMQKLTHALGELSHALEVYRISGHFILPPNCKEVPEIHRLLLAMDIQQPVTSKGSGQSVLQQSTVHTPGHSFSGSTTSRPAGSSLAHPRSSSQAQQPNSLPPLNRPANSPLTSPD